MISQRALDMAMARGVITAVQAEALGRIERTLPPADKPFAYAPDDEALRFVSGFADIFVTIGIVLFTGALAVIVGWGGRWTAAAAAVALATWPLAELFTRRRRMALPSIVLLLGFCAGAFLALLGGVATGPVSAAMGLAALHGSAPPDDSSALLLAALGATLLAMLHYRRFGVPITIAAGMLILLLALFGLLLITAPDAGPRAYAALAFAWGLVTFALAMRYDLSDAARTTRRSDIAFWLHLLAAPLVVHALVDQVLPTGLDQMTMPVAGAVLAGFVLLGAIALIIDRRAVLVAGLLYAGIAFGSVIQSFGLSNSNLLVPIVLCTLGALILVLSAGWLSLRAALLRLCPAGLASRLPRPMGSSQS